MREDLDYPAERLARLEAWQKEISNNIGTLQALVEALQECKYIVSVTETALGYNIVLNDQSVLCIEVRKDLKADRVRPDGVEMEPGSTAGGNIVVWAPQVENKAAIVVVLTDGEGHGWTYRLEFTSVKVPLQNHIK